jgi:RadC-like JAB domain
MYRPHRRRSEALRPAWVRLIKEVDPSQPEPVQVRCPQDAVNLLRERAARELIEVFYVIALNSQSRVIAIQEVTRGILQLLPRASARSVPARHRLRRGGHHRGPQPPERGPYPERR